ncbi:MAG TPA: N-acetylmuramoyl-L-alanine amidase [Acetobacteraceae bacterium]|jgi:N-acetylmuramoyl-L-alanine amidase|nr:N-acetylmuramoyl-L-alanine amidase [Acetobacteraceae bacterium]
MIGFGASATFLLPDRARPSPVPTLPAAATVRRAPSRGPLPTVVLDPGHGGKDPGAIGVTGTYEKHIAFATAQELMRQLLASGRYRVELTRGRDVFIPLEERVAIAEQHGATLFVSMHADAINDPAIRGASVYTLAGTASDAQTAALAQRENSADRFAGPRYGGGKVTPEVAKILASLVRQETRVGSARMARRIVGALDRDLPLLQNPARHATFVVLKAADIPSVLVEMGFMSNREDEAALRRPEHRTVVATAMKRAVDGYFAGSGAFLTAG